ncbi:class I fructose-bisphosphate aldolase family protein [Streptomyces griseiscabiei]|uniref:Class I fructose-bisphosphate aldolase family protein n=1 Tax=Streptomyces griseiscabiei TaxID=2993540 RepID=A0ABU4KV64_9ACTN|nr:class I fructose-bisphosphate aldolase family protein [Streptomyces griseiscabiei]MBZ3902945.1 class I fructose-bisphosphate aldolase family protein [Streptomyces griseiscabiei]MDX2907256.1 class I fructose-bisphosphate aldolase family protein [Streptomyces griseiscabiei]
MLKTGKPLRWRRLSPAGDDRHLLIPLDHSVSDGPVAPPGQWDDLLRELVAGGADGIIVHKGRARTLAPDILGNCALVVHLSASTACSADVDAKVLVGDVEEAVALGADAVSVHVNIGSDTEGRQLADLGAVARSCDTWGMPLIAMVYPRGPRIDNPHDPALLAHIVNVAADLGADMVKTTVALPLDRMAEVVAHSPIPVLAAGGPPDGSDLIEYGTAVMAAGCRGLAVGRRVFSSPSPAALVSRLAAVVHGHGDGGHTNDMGMTEESALLPSHPHYSTIVAGVA